MADIDDRLLVGEALDGEPVPEAVIAFLGDARGALVESPGEQAAAAHLRAMSQTAQTESAAAPPRRRLKLALALRPGLAAGSVAGAFAVCATLSAIGALPAPVQAALADASRAVGVEVPEPGSEHSHKGVDPEQHRRPAADNPPGPDSKSPAARSAAPPPPRAADSSGVTSVGGTCGASDPSLAACDPEDPGSSGPGNGDGWADTPRGNSDPSEDGPDEAGQSQSEATGADSAQEAAEPGFEEPYKEEHP